MKASILQQSKALAVGGVLALGLLSSLAPAMADPPDERRREQVKRWAEIEREREKRWAERERERDQRDAEREREYLKHQAEVEREREQRWAEVERQRLKRRRQWLERQRRGYRYAPRAERPTVEIREVPRRP